MEYQVVRSKRRTIAIEIKPDGSVLVRAPYWALNAEIRLFVRAKSAWIEEHVRKVQKRAAESQLAGQPLSEDELKDLRKAAKKDLPARAERFAEQMSVGYGQLAIRCQKTRWGSCSAKGNINLNLLLMLCPEDVRDYVVVHELSHLKEMNHSKRFWSVVESTLPDYRVSKKWLKDNGAAIMARVPHES